MTIYEVLFLTQGGIEIWQEEDGLSLTADILGPNGLSALSSYTYKDVVFCHINESMLDMEEYYHWKDTAILPDKDLFCWRRYYLFVPSVPSPVSSSPVSSSPVPPPLSLWLSVPETEHLSSYSCRELFTEWLAHTS